MSSALRLQRESDLIKTEERDQRRCNGPVMLGPPGVTANTGYCPRDHEHVSGSVVATSLSGPVQVHVVDTDSYRYPGSGVAQL